MYLTRIQKVIWKRIYDLFLELINYCAFIQLMIVKSTHPATMTHKAVVSVLVNIVTTVWFFFLRKKRKWTQLRRRRLSFVNKMSELVCTELTKTKVGVHFCRKIPTSAQVAHRKKIFDGRQRRWSRFRWISPNGHRIWRMPSCAAQPSWHDFASKTLFGNELCRDNTVSHSIIRIVLFALVLSSRN